MSDSLTPRVSTDFDFTLGKTVEKSSPHIKYRAMPVYNPKANSLATKKICNKWRQSGNTMDENCFIMIN